MAYPRGIERITWPTVFRALKKLWACKRATQELRDCWTAGLTPEQAWAELASRQSGDVNVHLRSYYFGKRMEYDTPAGVAEMVWVVDRVVELSKDAVERRIAAKACAFVGYGDGFTHGYDPGRLAGAWPVVVSFLKRAAKARSNQEKI
jgi:hypothetical protein